MARHRSSAVPLGWAYAALIVYASLYPFSGWHVPGVSPWAFLALPWPHWWTWFDLVSNLLGYMPMGALVFGGLVRSGQGAGKSFGVALLMGTAMSLAMETAQNYLPQRVSSNVDLALNAAGTALGALLGLAVHALGGVERWQHVRDRWFIARSAGGLALLLLWPVGLLFPTPLPLGVGQVLSHLREAVAELLQDTPVAEWSSQVLSPDALPAQLAPAGEFSAVALGLLAPCLVAFTVSLPGWRRFVLVLGAITVGYAATTLSTALNFGPQHALAWRTATAGLALGTGLLVACALAWVPRRAAAALGLMVLAALVALVAQAPADAYFAESLQAWEQGRFIRFHGVAQWVGWLWPYVAMAYLLARVGARDESTPKMAA